MNPFIIYIWGVVDNVRFAFGFLIFASIAASLLFWLVYTDVDESDFNHVTYTYQFCARKMWTFAIASILFSVGLALIPDSKTVAAMYVIPKIAESDIIQKDVPDLYRSAMDALKEKLTDNKKR